MTQAGVLAVEVDTLCQLPIEKLAYMLLDNFHKTNSWSAHNWFLGAKGHYGSGQHLMHLSEAWSWLTNKCMIVRDPENLSQESYKVSISGVKALRDKSFEKIIAAERINLNLHPTLSEKVRPIFLSGDYETACFKAMKEVEVRVRDLSGLGKHEIGARLMRTAFNPDNGPLTDKNLEGGERNARSDLFAGAMGCFKNPTSHRSVTYSDVNEACEIIFLADLLLRMLDDD